MNRKIVLATILNVLLLKNVTANQPELNTFIENEGFAGSITIYDLKNDTWVYSDKKDADVELLPASTFKIVNSLIALEEKVITTDEMLKWDGKYRKFKDRVMTSWNSDTDIENAFKNSTIWFYVELSKRIGRKAYEKYLKKISYGNLVLNEKGFDFWNYGGFAVSPKNQIRFLLKLYKNELPFSNKNMDYVKNIMIQEKNDNFVLRGKTGWGMKDGKEIGWYVGYVENEGSACFFATRIISDMKNISSNFSSSRKKITMEVLKELGYIK